MLDIDEDNLRQGVLGLVVALVEVIEDAMRLQALKRMESGLLNDEEIERLGNALFDLRCAIEEIKEEQGISETVRGIRQDLDSIVDDTLEKIINPARWEETIAAH